MIPTKGLTQMYTGERATEFCQHILTYIQCLDWYET